jgi:hypothetical protein
MATVLTREIEILEGSIPASRSKLASCPILYVPCCKYLLG